MRTSRLDKYEKLVLVALATALPTCTNKSLLPVGAPTPTITDLDARSAPVTLSTETQAERYAVVFFYPKNDTPDCTREACAFRNAFAKYSAASVTLFGVSRDSENSHRAFREKYSLPFPMVADTSGAVQRAYHVPDSFPGVAKRVSFLVGPDSKIARVWPDVDPGVHTTNVLAAIDMLKNKR